MKSKGWVYFLLVNLTLVQGGIKDDLRTRFSGNEDDLENILNLLEKQNLLQTWTKILENPNPALLVIDVQNDFISGSMELEGADELIETIQDVASGWDWGKVVFSQDWHPRDHISFFSNVEKRPLDETWRNENPGEISVYDEVVFAATPPYSQILWPGHCVQETEGADFPKELKPLVGANSTYLIRKGTNPEVDSYSAFFDNNGNGNGDTGLKDILLGTVTEVVVVGLATDYCVGRTTIDAQGLGIPATILLDVSRGVANQSIQDMLGRIENSGGRSTTWENWRTDEWSRAKHIAQTLISQGSREPKSGFSDTFVENSGTKTSTFNCALGLGTYLILIFTLLNRHFM